MYLSRWKILAGMLSVSLGGLATVAGQCPKPDSSKGSKNPADMPISADAPVLPQAPASPMPKIPTPGPTVPTLDLPIPATPMLPSGPTVPALAVAPPSTGAPPLPVPIQLAPAQLIPAPAPQVLPTSGPSIPQLTTVAPTAQPAQVIIPYQSQSNQAVTPPPSTEFTPLPSTAVPVSPPSLGQAIPTQKPTPTVVPASNVTTSTTKYRIVLRVGEGEPTFEVRSGDDLMLKVVSDKVDVKSPEKGTGLSSVKASGKVHFAGFGAEGTCDELSFLAGTGEVAMSGNVKIHVKDKLGRVESELSTETIKYKIDPSAISGSLKP